MGGKPGSGADGWPVSSRVRRWGLFGPLADGWLGRRPPGPMPQLKDGVRCGFKVSRFPDFWPYWGDGNNPYRAQACARVPERVWSLGLFSSVFFLHIL